MKNLFALHLPDDNTNRFEHNNSQFGCNLVWLNVTLLTLVELKKKGYINFTSCVYCTYIETLRI